MRSITRCAGAAIAGAALLFAAAPVVQAEQSSPGTTGTPALPPPSSSQYVACQNVEDANSNAAQSLTGLLGIVLGNSSSPVGINCSPIDDPTSAAEGTYVLDCTNGNNDFNGLVVVGCTPVDQEL